MSFIVSSAWQLSGAEALLSSIGEGASQLARTKSRYALPAVSDLFRLAYAGLVDLTGDNPAFGMYGIKLLPKEKPRDDIHQYLWNKIYDLNRPHIPITAARQLYYREKAFPGWLGEFGEKGKPFDGQYYYPNAVRNGVVDRDVQNALLFDTEPLDLSTILLLWRYDFINDEEFNNYLKILGYTRKWERNNIVQAANYLPSYAELSAYAASGLLDTDYLDRWNLRDGKPKAWQQLTDRFQSGWNLKLVDQTGSAVFTPNMDELIWRNHWNRLGPEQAFLMLRRLTPINVAKYKADLPNIRVFTEDDYRQVMRYNGFTDPQIDSLRAITYAPLGLRHVRLLVNNNVITEAQSSDYLQQQGFIKDDADKLAKAYQVDNERKAFGKIREDAKSKILQSFELGIIDADELAIQLYRVTIQDANALASYDTLPMAARLGTALGDVNVKLTVSAAQFDDKYKTTKIGVQLTKSRYLRGIIDATEVARQLGIMGLVPNKIQTYLQMWRLEKETHRREINANQIIKWGETGILSVQQVIFRLRNLNYADADINGMIAEAQMRINQSVAKALEGQAKIEQKTIKEQQSALKAQQAALDKQKKQQKAVIEAEKKSAGRANIISFYTDKLITREQALERLTRDEVGLVDAELYLNQADKKQKAKDAKSAAKNKKATPGSAGPAAGGGASSQSKP